MTSSLCHPIHVAAAANGTALRDDVVGLVCDVIDDLALLAEAGI